MSHDKIRSAARRRMAQTGESYTAARREVIKTYTAARRDVSVSDSSSFETTMPDVSWISDALRQAVMPKHLAKTMRAATMPDVSWISDALRQAVMPKHLAKTMRAATMPKWLAEGSSSIEGEPQDLGRRGRAGRAFQGLSPVRGAPDAGPHGGPALI